MRGFCFLLNRFQLNSIPRTADHSGMNNQAPTPQPNPRDLAAAILAEPTLAGRRALIERCPQELRPIVEEHVRNGFAKIKSYRQHLEQRAGLASQKPPAAPRREDSPNITNHPKSAPEVGNSYLTKLRATVRGAA